MSYRLNPYLSFPGNARQAMDFYAEVFGGTLTMSTFGEFGADGPDAENIMHAQLVADDLALMAADTPPGTDHQPGNTMSVSLSGDDAAQLRAFWDKLSQDAVVPVPLEKQMWGDEFGMCVDKFGTSWMVNIAAAQAE